MEELCMHIEYFNRPALKAEARALLRTAQVGPKRFTALYLLITELLSLFLFIVIPRVTMNLTLSIGETGSSMFSLFLTILFSLLTAILGVGFILYCMTIRKGERAGYLTLFDGFCLVGKLIGLFLLTSLLVFAWSMLFLIPGIIASYRYSFALYNLLENPNLGILEAIDMSKRQTMGYKGQLFMLDLSYLGWGVLSAAPMLLYLLYTIIQLSMLPTGSAMYNAQVLMFMLMGMIFVMAITMIWSLVVMLFVLPNYQCVLLACFDIAKRTSGVGVIANASSDTFDNTSTGFTGPDGL